MNRKYGFIGFTVLILSLLLAPVFAVTGENAELSGERTYIVDFKDDITLFSAKERDERFNILTESELMECLEAGIVEYYEENYAVELLSDTETSDTVREIPASKWELEMISASEAARIGCVGQEVTVGVIDSGVYCHPDLLDSIKPGYNYIKKNDDVTDNMGHGTFVSGLIAANAGELGALGIAPKANIIPLKCFDLGYTTRVSQICNAIYDAVDVYNCDIINMSLGITSYSAKLFEAVNYAVENGVVIVAAVGNKGTQTLYYPAAFENVIGVGSVNENYERSSFSEYNESVFVMAPGEKVMSTDTNGSYRTDSGTSFAAPIVSGMVAVMMNIDSDLTYETAAEYLKNSAVDLGDEGYDIYYGHGLVDVKACIGMMLEDQHKPEVLPDGGEASDLDAVLFLRYLAVRALSEISDNITHVDGDGDISNRDDTEENDLKTDETTDAVTDTHKADECDEPDYMVELLSFSDVSDDDWFYESVKYVYENNLMRGVSDSEFAPSALLTRAMFVTILHRMDGAPTVYGHSFTDVECGSWYENAVAWAASKGIVYGISSAEFAPDANITREQMATIIYRYAKYKNSDFTPQGDVHITSYGDYADISDFAVEAIDYVCEKEIMSGMGTGALYPLANATRAEAAAVFMRASAVLD